MPYVMPVIALVGAGISAYGSIKQGQEIKQAQDYNAAIAQGEAGLVRQNAILNEYRQRQEVAAMTGQQVAGYAKRGVVATTGSPLDIIANSISNAELDIQIGKYNAESEAQNRESQAAMNRWAGNEAVKSSYYRAAGTLLSSATESGYKLSKEKFGKTKIGE